VDWRLSAGTILSVPSRSRPGESVTAVFSSWWPESNGTIHREPASTSTTLLGGVAGLASNIVLILGLLLFMGLDAIPELRHG
jgi:hypothetical protein